MMISSFLFYAGWFHITAGSIFLELPTFAAMASTWFLLHMARADKMFSIVAKHTAGVAATSNVVVSGNQRGTWHEGSSAPPLLQNMEVVHHHAGTARASIQVATIPSGARDNKPFFNFKEKSEHHLNHPRCIIWGIRVASSRCNKKL
jgi:hypothetical protein